jgi:hypothetical protein
VWSCLYARRPFHSENHAQPWRLMLRTSDRPIGKARRVRASDRRSWALEEGGSDEMLLIKFTRALENCGFAAAGE